MDTETIIFRYGFTEEEAEAIQKAARIWAERVKHHIEEVIEAVLHILSAGSSEFEKLEDLRKELEEIGREPRPAAEDGAEPGAGHRTAIPGGDSPRRAGKVL